MKYKYIEALNINKNVISFNRIFVDITWSVIWAIILHQIVYWDDKMWWEFYKFITPPSNVEWLRKDKYKVWDSRVEEIWISRDVFTSALKRFSYKLGKSKNIIRKDEALVTYYTDSNRITHYKLNRDMLNKKIWESLSKNTLS